MLKLSAERCATAEAGNPRDAGVVQLGDQLVITTLSHGRNDLTCCSSAANSASSAAHTSGPFGCSTAALASPSGIESTRQPPHLCRAPGGLIWPPREDIGAGSIAGNRSDMARTRSRSSRQGSGDEKGTKHMAAAARRDVGDVPGAQPLEQLAELGGLAVDVAVGAASEVERQHPPAGRARVVHRHRARLARRIGGQRPGVAGRVGAAAVMRDPDMRRTGDRGRDRTPGGLCGGAREARLVYRNCGTSLGVSLGGNADLAVDHLLSWPRLLAFCSVRDVGWQPVAELELAGMQVSCAAPLARGLGVPGLIAPPGA